MKRIAFALTALTAAAIAIAPASYAAPDFDELRQENLNKSAMDFDALRRENLDKDAVNFDELRRENFDKDAVTGIDVVDVKRVDFDALRRENLDKDAAEPGAPWYEKLEEGVGL